MTDLSSQSSPATARPNDVMPNELGSALRNGRLLALIFVGLTIVFVYGYIQRSSTATDLQTQIQQRERQIVEANFRTAELEAELRYVASEDFLDKIAREELGLAKPGETALIILGETSAPAHEDGQSAGSDAGDGATLSQAAPRAPAAEQPSTAQWAATSNNQRPAQTQPAARSSQQPPWQAWLELFALSPHP